MSTRKDRGDRGEAEVARLLRLRGEDAIALPREFVDRRKRERLRAAAAAYLSAHELDAPARFDVAEVYETADGTLRVEYLEDAFS